MKKVVSIVALSCLLIAPVTSYAQKIGYVVVNSVFAEYDKQNGISKKINEQFGGKRKELEDLNAKIKSLGKEIETNSLLMTESKLEGSKKKLNEMFIEFRNKEMAVQKEFKKAQNIEMGQFNKVASEIINKYGKEKGFDMILSEGAVYVADKVNITDDIISRLAKAKK